MRTLGLLCLLTLPCLAQYSASREGDIVRLQDAKAQAVVTINPARGNNGASFQIKGKDVLQSGSGQSGIPFLEPWANRLDEQAFYANGKKYTLNMGLGNVRGANPLHGLLQNAAFEVVEAKADQNSAWLSTRIDFYKNPDWMAQFPFAHTIEMTHRLKDGALEISVKLTNLSIAPMPVSVGFHPYFKVNDAPRDEWTFGVAARTHYLLTPQLIPTGETETVAKFIPDNPGGTLKGKKFDDLFGDLIRDASGNAVMWVQGKSERVEVVFGPKFTAAVVYFPAGPTQNFICLEPMSIISDGFNLAQKGLYKELQSIPPGQSWQESFWIRPSGF